MSKIKLKKFKKKFSKVKFGFIFLACFLFLFVIGTSYSLLTTEEKITGSARVYKYEYVCKYDITSYLTLVQKWGTTGAYHYQYKVTIENNEDTDIDGWTIYAKGPSDLEVDFANATYTKRSDNTLVIDDVEWNANIPANGSTDVEVAFITAEDTLTFTEFYVNECETTIDMNVDKADDSVVLTNLSIAPSTYSMRVGEFATLQAKLTPTNAGNSYTWSTSDSSILTVSDKGKIKGISAGVATVTITSDNGLTGTCVVTVEEETTTTTTEDPNPGMTELNVDYNQLYYYENMFQFEFTFTSNLDEDLTDFSFKLDLPEGTTYTFWNNPGVTADGNTFNVHLLWSKLNKEKSMFVSGVVNLPKGYYGKDIQKIKFYNFNKL